MLLTYFVKVFPKKIKLPKGALLKKINFLKKIGEIVPMKIRAHTMRKLR